jgi:hypothetical protein
VWTEAIHGGPPPDGSDVSTFLQRAVDTRRSNFEYVNKAFQYIEYITGEFSGLGLCDIWVIISALYIIDENVFISLLDDKAFERMSGNSDYFNVRSPPKRTTNIKIALTKLTLLIKDLYSICDDIYFKLS